MLNNGIMFGDQGPLMDGTWYNPSTNDSFTVKDSFFEDGQYMVTTTDGRMLGYDMIQNYIKTDKPITVNTANDNIPNEVINEIDDSLFIDDDIYDNKQTLGNLNQVNHSIVVSTTTNEDIIEKALSKANKPQVVADVNWVDFPKKHIEMLNEIMGIDTKEIVEWYTKQLDTTEIAIAIHNSLVSYINDQLYGRVQNTIEIDLTLESEKFTEKEPINVTGYTSRKFADAPKTPKKTTPKKTTKKTKK